MAKRQVITNQGLSLLATSSKLSGQYYWIGHYALAYVPNNWKTTEETIELPDRACFAGDPAYPEVPINDPDPVVPSMTRLTKYGDVIYNVWQGDMAGTGFVNGESDGSAGGDLYGSSLYPENVKKHYRYVLGADGRNHLVTWVERQGLMKGMHVYPGTDGIAQSAMAIPAPLYYMGDVLGKVSVDDYFNSLPTFENQTTNGATTYPSVQVYLKAVLAEDNSTIRPERSIFVPKVTSDYRDYKNALGQTCDKTYFSVEKYPPSRLFDLNPIPPEVSTAFDVTSWYTGDGTYTRFVEGADADAYECHEFWKLHTISNFNRFHATTTSTGDVVLDDIAAKNIAKTTKLFPIANYKVMSTEAGTLKSDGERLEVASAIRFTLDIDLVNGTLATGTDDAINGTLKETRLGVWDKYKDGNNTIDPEDPYKWVDDGQHKNALDKLGGPLYTSTHSSFKFNRIGIYAVPMRTAPYYTDNSFGTNPNTGNLELQIDPNQEPILFAVCDFDTVIEVSDASDGITKFSYDFEVNFDLESTKADSCIIRNAAIFYNLYEDDMQKMIENQLLLAASLSNAVTEMGIEQAYERQRLDQLTTPIGEPVTGGQGGSGTGGCCETPDMSNVYSPKAHTHNDILRNISDANASKEGGLKGIDTLVEGHTIPDTTVTYRLGLDAVALGKGTFAAANYAFVMGSGSGVRGNAELSSVLNGLGNVIAGSKSSLIGGGTGNLIDIESDGSVIVGGDYNLVKGIEKSFIGVALNALIASEPNYWMDGSLIPNSFEFANNVILGGNAPTVTNSRGVLLGVANNTRVTNSISSGVLLSNEKQTADLGEVAMTSRIFDSNLALVLLGDDASILQSESSWIGSGWGNYISYSTNAVIAGGKHNNIGDTGFLYGVEYGNDPYMYMKLVKDVKNWTEDCLILGGDYNKINTKMSKEPMLTIMFNMALQMSSSKHSAILGGNYNQILNASGSVIVGGSNNYINVAIESDYKHTMQDVQKISGYPVVPGSYTKTIDVGLGFYYIWQKNGSASIQPVLNQDDAFVGESEGFKVYSITDRFNVYYLRETPSSFVFTGEDYFSATRLSNNFIGVGSNIINNGLESTVIGGFQNYILNNSSKSLIASGSFNLIDSGPFNAILSGSYNTVVTGSENSLIIGGYQNAIGNSKMSAILGGQNNEIVGKSNVGIFGHDISANIDESFIVNRITLYDSEIVLGKYKEYKNDSGEWVTDMPANMRPVADSLMIVTGLAERKNNAGESLLVAKIGWISKDDFKSKFGIS
jgi:hypothetical protein